MLILVLLGMHFDAVVVENKTFLLLLRLALAILCHLHIFARKHRKSGMDFIIMIIFIPIQIVMRE